MQGVKLDNIYIKLMEQLVRLVRLHETLSNILSEELLCMENLNSEGISECAQSKQTVLAEILLVESKRVSIASELCTYMGLPTTATITELAAVSPPKESNAFLVAQKALTQILKICREKNTANMALAQDALVKIESMKANILGLKNNNAENYNAHGNRNPVIEHGGRLLSERA